MNWLGIRIGSIIKEVAPTTLLDAGCGLCTPTRGLNVPITIAVDIYREYLYKVTDCAVPICYDVRKVKELFLPKYFDVVVCIDVIEHLERSEGLKLRVDLEELCKKIILFYTPNGFTPQELRNGKDAWGFSNPAQEHVSGFNPEDFPGYTIEMFKNGSNFLAWKHL
jgi:2-polyprenyl-3-methyl-5-hydroxy-6-metoxy-1,4-benzoquinol methylase